MTGLTVPEVPDNAGTTVLRIFSGIGAVLLLFVSALFTLGTSLAAPLGVFAGNLLARRKGRPFTRVASWLYAAGASAIAMVLVVVALFSLLPENTWHEIQEAAVKAQTEDASRGPAWMRPDPVTETIVTSRAFTIVFGVVGLLIGCALFGAIAGTPGWAATLLLGYAIRGRRAELVERGGT